MAKKEETGELVLEIEKFPYGVSEHADAKLADLLNTIIANQRIIELRLDNIDAHLMMLRDRNRKY